MDPHFTYFATTSLNEILSETFGSCLSVCLPVFLQDAGKVDRGEH